MWDWLSFFLKTARNWLSFRCYQKGTGQIGPPKSLILFSESLLLPLMNSILLSPFNSKWESRGLATTVAYGWQTTYLWLKVHERSLRLTSQAYRACLDCWLLCFTNECAARKTIWSWWAWHNAGWRLWHLQQQQQQQQKIISVEDWHLVAMVETSVCHFHCRYFCKLFLIVLYAWACMVHLWETGKNISYHVIQ